MKDRAASVIRPSVDVGRALEALDAKVDRLIALVEQAVSAPLPERTWLSIDEAAALINRTPQAVRLRCRVNRIGQKVNGEWRVDRGRLLSQN